MRRKEKRQVQERVRTNRVNNKERKHTSEKWRVKKMRDEKGTRGKNKTQLHELNKCSKFGIVIVWEERIRDEMIPLHIYRNYRSDKKAKKELTSISRSIQNLSVWSNWCARREREKYQRIRRRRAFFVDTGARTRDPVKAQGEHKSFNHWTSLPVTANPTSVLLWDYERVTIQLEIVVQSNECPMNVLSKYRICDDWDSVIKEQRRIDRVKQRRNRQTAVTNWLPINLRTINQSWASTSLPAMPLYGYRRIWAEKTRARLDRYKQELWTKGWNITPWYNKTNEIRNSKR